MKSVGLSNMVDRLSFFLLSAIIIWAPIPIGSNPDWSVAILTIFSSIVFLSCWISALVNRRSFGVLAYALFGIIPLLGYLFLLGFQYVGGYNPDSLLISLDPYATKIQILLTVSYILVFISTLLICDSSNKIKKICWVIVFSGSLQAIIAIILLSSQSSYQIFFLDLDHSTRAKGTFSYHNSFAGYMEICISIGLGLLLGSYKVQTRVQSVKNNIFVLLEFFLSTKIILRLLIVLMVIGLVLTRSRMGNAALMIGLIVSLLIGLIYLKEMRKYLSILILSVILIDTIVIGQWVGLEKVLARLDNTELTKETKANNEIAKINGNRTVTKKEESLEQRAKPAYNTINMVKDRPLLGFGAGTFYTAYPPYKSLEDKGYFEHAHNDYLEILSDTGFVGGLFLFVFAIFCFIKSIKLISINAKEHKGIGFGVVIVLIALVLHSFVDFNLHIPANVLTLMVLLALPWVSGYLLNKKNN